MVGKFRKIETRVEKSAAKTRKRNTFTQFDLQAAKRLHTHLGTIGKWSSSRWADEFRLLRESLVPEDTSKARITSVLEALCSESLDFPIFSAANVRQNFSRLEKLLHKVQAETVHEISGDARNIVASLRRLTWPLDSDDQLEHCVELSLQRYGSFVKTAHKLWATESTHEKKKPFPRKTNLLLNFFEYLCRSKLLDPTVFVSRWMVEIHANIVRWESWNGDLVAMSFAFDSARFQKLLRGCVTQFGGSSVLWNSFWECLKNEIEKT